MPSFSPRAVLGGKGTGGAVTCPHWRSKYPGSKALYALTRKATLSLIRGKFKVPLTEYPPAPWLTFDVSKSRFPDVSFIAGSRVMRRTVPPMEPAPNRVPLRAAQHFDPFQVHHPRIER